MNRLKLIVALSLGTCVVSCQKKFLRPEEALQPPVVSTHDSMTRLSAFFLIQPPSPDTSISHKIAYDTLGRVNSITTFLWNIAYPHLFSIATYYYAGNDSMAYKKIEKFPVLTGRDTMQTTFYYYDNLKRLVKDSINYPNSAEVAQFNYSSSMITAFKSFDYFVYPFFRSTEIDTGYLNSAGNITRLSLWSINGAPANYTIDFTYDDKPNPFYQLNIRSTFRPLFTVDDLILGLDYYLQKNNILHIVENYYNTVFSYSYNASGFPTFQYLTSFRDASEDGFTAFVYEKR